MKIVEITEMIDSTVKYWIKDDEIIQCHGLHHEVVERDPQKFGVKLIPDAAILTRNVMKAGWARVGFSENKQSYIESYSVDQAKNAANWLLTLGVDNIYVSIKPDRAAFILKGHEIERFVKTQN